ncbi:MAG: helix-turn-helix transcriptional regulator [Desulfarculales bacterium]|jgi:plasmid maintenance system antidote protein VapI|nr:helix-turn-helix transcriptional regulator [Desulfarculales bacterium]
MSIGRQTHLADLVNKTQAHISTILSGKRRAGYELAERLAIVTDTDVALWIKGSADERRAAFKNWQKKKATSAKVASSQTILQNERF